MSDRRHLLIAVAIWAVLSVVSMVLVAGIHVFPEIASNEAQIEEDAFVVLSVVSMPVMWFVLVGMAYSAIRFRATSVDDVDGPPLHGHAGVQAGFLGISFLLVIGLFAYGAVGLIDIRGAQQSDFEVRVEAQQWEWHFHYANGGESTELHVPIDKRVHLVIESDDVIHSLWLPALGVKQDAVPGHPTQAYTTPTVAGSYGGRCAELCGFGHTDMVFTFLVQQQADLDAWLAALPTEAP